MNEELRLPVKTLPTSVMSPAFWLSASTKGLKVSNPVQIFSSFLGALSLFRCCVSHPSVLRTAGEREVDLVSRNLYVEGLPKHHMQYEGPRHAHTHAHTLLLVEDERPMTL